MNVKGAIIYLPVEFPERSVTFYKNLFSNTPDIFLEDGLIIIELPNLNLFLIEKNRFEAYYSLKTGRSVQLPKDNVGTIMSCILSSEEEVDKALIKVSEYGGKVTHDATINETLGVYAGYFSDPDGHIWELAYYPPEYNRILNFVNPN
ncbi:MULTISPECIES: VOC family protein [Chryseobacterium group]|uniref:VOC family protein n=1 Tax=Chryseobacterium salviniae TaxID=3101750 RepID=A0ABU6HP14_9FLAO|nr:MULTISPECIES: VOC family protein [Chryseobacterium group]MDV3879049.1 glyoxalase [Elizabethkingia anophelis]MEC3874764.1 VOC family protein [Chryseobacterium sp. T9W2-O]